jgi:hypothetical protein
MKTVRLLLCVIAGMAVASFANAASISKSQRNAVIFVANLAQGSSLEQAFYNVVQFAAATIAQGSLGPTYNHVTTIQGNNATLAQLYAALKAEANRSGSKAVDLIFVTHGLSNEVLFSDGKKSMTTVSSAITENLDSTQRSKLRIVFSTACFGASHRTAWTNAGFKTVSGSAGIYADSATSYPAFLGSWVIGTKFSDAVAVANAADPLRVSDNAAKAWFNSKNKPDLANQVNSVRSVRGTGTLTINLMP